MAKGYWVIPWPQRNALIRQYRDSSNADITKPKVAHHTITGGFWG